MQVYINCKNPYVQIHNLFLKAWCLQLLDLKLVSATNSRANNGKRSFGKLRCTPGLPSCTP